MTNQLIKWPKVLLYGDSITQYSFSSDGCFGSLISDMLQRKCDVLNRGFSGYNSRWNRIMLPRIVNDLIAQDVVAMTIFLGANDSCDQQLNPHQHVSLSEYKENLSKMVDYLESVGLSRDKVIVIGPPPCYEENWAQWCNTEGKVMSKNNALTGLYAEACGAAAEMRRVEHLELYNSMMANKEWSTYLNDGLHFSEAGSKFLFNKLWPLLEKRTAHLPALILPYWADVDSNHPDSSLLN